MEEQIASYISAYLEGGIFGFTFIQLTIWVIIGVIAGALLPKPRPFGLIGSMLGGVLGGLLAGWAVSSFPAIDLVSEMDRVPRAIRRPLSDGIAAFIGSLIVLTLLRVVVPKSMRN